jgi:transposase
LGLLCGGKPVVTDDRWKALEPLIEACRPHTKVPPRHLRRTMAALIWRHENGAKWRAIPAELGPWWMAAQTFIRWSRLGVWERLLAMAQERGVALGMSFLGGTAIRAHQKAAGAPNKKPRGQRGRVARRKRSAAPAVASARRRG